MLYEVITLFHRPGRRVAETPSGRWNKDQVEDGLGAPRHRIMLGDQLGETGGGDRQVDVRRPVAVAASYNFV